MPSLLPLDNIDEVVSKRKNSIAELKVIEMDILSIKRERMEILRLIEDVNDKIEIATQKDVSCLIFKVIEEMDAKLNKESEKFFADAMKIKSLRSETLSRIDGIFETEKEIDKITKKLEERIQELKHINDKIRWLVERRNIVYNDFIASDSTLFAHGPYSDIKW